MNFLERFECFSQLRLEFLKQVKVKNQVIELFSMGYTIKELPESERPRERLERQGVESLSNAELIALIIRTGLHGKNAKDVANDILQNFSVEKLSKASLSELREFEGVGKIKASQLKAAFELNRRKSSGDQDKLESFSDARELFRKRLDTLEQEELHAAYLSPNNELISVDRIFKGSLKNLSIDSREVVRKGLKQNASAVVLAHNHPMGDSEPSDRDVSTTLELKESLESFDISLLDHLVVGERSVSSMKRQELV